MLESVIRSLQHYCTVPQAAVDKNLLSKLRKKTGFPLLNCKKALEKFDNDIKQAEQWIREEAQKEGWAKATKLQGRPMSQGLVGLIKDDHSATLVEINCETDFVARNENFKDLVARVTDVCHKHFSATEADQVHLAKDEVNALTSEGSTLADLVAIQVGSVGENIALRRASFLRSTPSTVLSSYIHASGPQISVDNCKLGKFGALVKVECPDVTEVAAAMCQQVVGMNPKEIGTPELPKTEQKSDKKKKKDSEEMISQSKERIVEEEEKQLLRQEFILDSNLTVQKYLESNAPKVIDFVRFECGEVLPGEED